MMRGNIFFGLGVNQGWMQEYSREGGVTKMAPPGAGEIRGKVRIICCAPLH